MPFFFMCFEMFTLRRDREFIVVLWLTLRHEIFMSRCDKSRELIFYVMLDVGT